MIKIDITYIEPPQRCESCGIIAITRPYGLKHEEICQECADKDPCLTDIRKKDFLLGETSYE